MTRTRVFVIFLTVLALAACSREAEPPAATDQAAVADIAVEVDESAEPEASVSQAAADFTALCESRLGEAQNLFDSLVAREGEATVVTVLQPYNELARQVLDGTYEASLMFNVHPDADARNAAGACEQKFSAMTTRINLSREMFDGFLAVDISAEDAKTQHFVAKQLRVFRLNGVDRDEETREAISALNDEILKTGQAFDKNIAEDVRSIEVDSAEALAGMPEDWIAARPPGDNGMIRITTNYPDYLPLRKYVESDEIRKALTFEFLNRAYPQNEVVLNRLLEQRFELAQMTGYENWAERATANKMIGSAENADEFIRDGSAASEPRARQDYRELLARLQQIDPEATEVNLWQGSFLANLIRKEKYELDSAELRPYFEYQKMRDGIFDLVSYLFNLTIRPVDTETWHEDVGAYEVLSEGQLLGRFYLDMHPRDGKYGHAAMFQLRTGEKNKHLPEAVLVCNFPGGGGEKGYMENTQVQSFLHEFGHLIHWMVMGHQRWVDNTTPEWDFIEAPSMMLQEWMYDPDTLRKFATNDAGEPIPVDLVEKMDKARNFGQGMFIHGQMFNSALSLNFYNRDPASFELLDMYRELNQEMTLYPYMDGTHMFTSFGHLNGYSAYYYTYMWSLVIAMDMFSRFEAEGLRNQETSMDYRNKVLAAGGSKPASEFVADFLGRPYNFEAFQKRLEGSD
jgi:thimet oligopeptidase